MAGDEHEENEPSNEPETGKESMPSPTEEELFGSDLEAFLMALNQFSLLADRLEWPEGMPLDEDMNTTFSAFKIYWRQRIRQRKQTEHYEFSGEGENSTDTPPNMKDFKRFFHSRFRFQMGQEDEVEDEAIFIDPGEHQPEEEPGSDAAQQRERDFQEKWE